MTCFILPQARVPWLNASLYMTRYFVTHRTSIFLNNRGIFRSSRCTILVNIEMETTRPLSPVSTFQHLGINTRSSYKVIYKCTLSFLFQSPSLFATYSANTSRRMSRREHPRSRDFRHFSSRPHSTSALRLTSCVLQLPCVSVPRYVPERFICDAGYWSLSVRTETSIRLSGMGTARIRGSDAEHAVAPGVSSELDRLSTTISVVEEKMRGNALPVGKVCERAINPCCSNCHYDHTWSLGHLCCCRKA
jgi:hypothetical protein